MSEKTYQVQLGDAPAESMTQGQLDGLKARYGAERFSAYEVSEVKAPAKPSPEPETASGKPPRKAE